MDERIEYFGLYRNVRDTQQRERARSREGKEERERGTETEGLQKVLPRVA